MAEGAQGGRQGGRQAAGREGEGGTDRERLALGAVFDGGEVAEVGHRQLGQIVVLLPFVRGTVSSVRSKWRIMHATFVWHTRTHTQTRTHARTHAHTQSFARTRLCTMKGSLAPGLGPQPLPLSLNRSITNLSLNPRPPRSLAHQRLARTLLRPLPIPSREVKALLHSRSSCCQMMLLMRA